MAVDGPAYGSGPYPYTASKPKPYVSGTQSGTCRTLEREELTVIAAVLSVTGGVRPVPRGVVKLRGGEHVGMWWKMECDWEIGIQRCRYAMSIRVLLRWYIYALADPHVLEDLSFERDVDAYRHPTLVSQASNPSFQAN